MMVVVGTVEIHPDDVAKALKLGLTSVSKSKREPGCMHYMFSRDRTQPNRFLIVECWTTPEALAAHMESQHVEAFRGGLHELRINRLTVQRFQVDSPTELPGLAAKHPGS